MTSTPIPRRRCDRCAAPAFCLVIRRTGEAGPARYLCRRHVAALVENCDRSPKIAARWRGYYLRRPLARDLTAQIERTAARLASDGSPRAHYAALVAEHLAEHLAAGRLTFAEVADEVADIEAGVYGDGN